MKLFHIMACGMVIWLMMSIGESKADEDDEDEDLEEEREKERRRNEMLEKYNRDPWLYCDTCLVTMQEIGNVMVVTSNKEKITVGGFRMDKDQEKLPMKHSEIFLSEIVDYACGAMYQFGIFTNPDTGAKHIIRATPFQGMYAPPTKKFLKTGKEVTESIVWACDIIMEYYEDEIIAFWKERDPKEGSDQLSQRFCIDHAKLCTQSDVESQMWATAEAAMMNIKDIDNPQPEPADEGDDEDTEDGRTEL